ncbi:MAG: histidinol-phosphatase [Treponema sp.]|nr:histidinol-phosphatase [Treponema sp.]
MEYIYETHLHTVQGSGCGSSRGRDYIQRYLDIGFTGIIVTDHFYNGYTAVNRSLSWEKWVHQFCKGFEDAREEGARRGLDVFFGWEETFRGGDDYLIYGLDRNWLLEHPQVRFWTREEQFEQVRQSGGCIVHAHPFRQYPHINRICLSSAIDGVEAGNRAHHQSFDALAYSYAKKLGFPVLAGSDIHYVDGIIDIDSVFGVILDKKMESIADYVDAIKKNSIAGLRVTEGRFKLHGNERIDMPVDILDIHDLGISKLALTGGN